jgi:transcriptional regulator with XRE-family HTH domain
MNDLVKHSGLRQEDLANLSGVSQPKISRALSAGKASFTDVELQKLAECLACSVAYVTGESNERGAPPVITRVPDEPNAIEVAINAVYDNKRFELRDANAAVAAAQTMPMLVDAGAEHGWARDFIEAARWLRTHNQRPTIDAIKDRVLLMRYGSVRDLNDVMTSANAEADAVAAKWNAAQSRSKSKKR